MLVPREAGVSFSCPLLNLCIPEDSQGTGNAFGLGEEIQAPNTLSPVCPSSHAGLFSGLGTQAFAQCSGSSSSSSSSSSFLTPVSPQRGPPGQSS